MQPISRTIADLPLPAPEALAHSHKLATHIRTEIAATGGHIPFARYMELALYAPGLGYYSAGARKFGAVGDFVTAPELSPLFSRCLARQCAEVLGALGGGSILELGAGSGVMAADILLELEHLGALPEHYLILEVSADLRERQRALLGERAPKLLPRVRWLDALPDGHVGLMLGNEVLDALPVRRFRKTAQGYQEFCVAADSEGFRWELAMADVPFGTALANLETTLAAPLPAGYESELCTLLPAFMASLAASLERGALLLMDYGYPRRAFYHAERGMGTLMCHYRQHAHPDPFLYPGLQDITAHVDFTAVAETATAAHLDFAGYTTQAHLLMALGIAGMSQGDMRLAQQVKLLTLPEEMGERFKAIGFTKGMDLPLSGFRLRDLSRQL